MKEIQQKSALLLILLIGFAFIAIGLTIGYYLEIGGIDSAAAAGLPLPIE